MAADAQRSSRSNLHTAIDYPPRARKVNSAGHARGEQKASAEQAVSMPAPNEESQPEQAPHTELPRQTSAPLSTLAAKSPQQIQPVPVPGRAFSSGPLYVPPQPVKQAIPKIQAFDKQFLTGSPRIEITVYVDKNGNVSNAQLSSTKKVNPVLAAAALSAARQWTFRPATLNGMKIESEHTIVFQFQDRH